MQIIEAKQKIKQITPSQIEIYNSCGFPLNSNQEMFGSGFKKVFSSCEQNDIKFAYESNEDGFSFIFYREKCLFKS